MKQFLFTAVSILTIIPVMAQEITAVTQDHFVQETKAYPVQNCFEVEIPIYGRVDGGSNAADILGGAFIGGLLGKGITGENEGAAAGAFIGGLLGNEHSNQNMAIIGYRPESRCNTEYESYDITVYSHSTITFTDNDTEFTLRYHKQ